MLDDLRKQAEDTNLEELQEYELEEGSEVGKRARLPTLPSLGLTPQQRFVIALLLFSVVCLTSALVLLVTGKIAIPF
jgi:hypothetical protein